MGLYRRADSPYWWMRLEGFGRNESSGVIADARSAEIRKQQKQLAQDVYIARMNALTRRTSRLPAKQTIAFGRWADWYEQHVLPKRRGAERELEIIGTLRHFFGAADLSAITTDRVQEYITSRAGLQPRTINREVAVLKAMLKAAVPRYFDASPLHGMPLLRTVRAKKHVLSAADEKKLLKAMTPLDRAFFLTGLDSLMRMSNLINLRRDEDKGDHFALTDSKTGPYIAIISARVRKALDALPDEGEYYFPHRRVAKTARDRRGTVRQWLERVCHKAGVDYGRGAGITFHSATRATGATRILQAGHDLRTLQEVGNWTDIRSAAGYLETERGRMQKAVASITPRLRKKRTSKKSPAKQPIST